MKERKYTRREFVGTVAAGAGLLIASKTAFGGTAEAKAGGAFKMVKLGKSGIKTTLLGMGTGFSGSNRSSAITRAGVAETVIKTAYDKGIRFFDCADTYGTHPFTARALKGLPREKYVLSSKIWRMGGGVPEPERPDANIVVDRFRKELDTDYIDIVQLHCMMKGEWTDEQKAQMDILETLKAKGVIRAHGVSVHSFAALEAAAASDWVDVIHVRINPFGAAMDSKDPQQVVPVIKKMHDSGKGIIGMKLVGGGNFKADSEKIDQSVKFVLGLGTVDMIIVGFENVDQIDNYVGRIDTALNSLKS